MKIFILFLLFLTVLGAGQSMANIDTELEKIVTKYKIPSMSVMILKDDKIQFQSYFGLRKIEEKDIISATDSFHLGSCGKAFTATLILRLMDEGKLNIEDPVTKYLTKLDPKKFGDIRIKHLLSHSAGISGNVEGDWWSRMYTFDITASKGREIAIEFLANSKRLEKAGRTYLYSNLGYMVLAQIVENIENKSFEEVLFEKLLKPFKMNSCTLGPVGRNINSLGPWPHEFKDKLYKSLDPKLIYSDNPPAMSAAGGISCNQADWAKFVFFVMGVGENTNYLKQETKDLIMKENLSNYTYGAWVRDSTDWSGNVLVHTGSNTLNYSYVLIATDQKFAFLINTNSPSSDAVFEFLPILKEYYVNLKLEK